MIIAIILLFLVGCFISYQIGKTNEKTNRFKKYKILSIPDELYENPKLMAEIKISAWDDNTVIMFGDTDDDLKAFNISKTEFK